jgi:hypothetical protein
VELSTSFVLQRCTCIHAYSYSLVDGDQDVLLVTFSCLLSRKLKWYPSPSLILHRDTILFIQLTTNIYAWGCRYVREAWHMLYVDVARPDLVWVWPTKHGQEMEWPFLVQALHGGCPKLTAIGACLYLYAVYLTWGEKNLCNQSWGLLQLGGCRWTMSTYGFTHLGIYFPTFWVHDLALVEKIYAEMVEIWQKKIEAHDKMGLCIVHGSETKGLLANLVRGGRGMVATKRPEFDSSLERIYRTS